MIVKAFLFLFFMIWPKLVPSNIRGILDAGDQDLQLYSALIPNIFRWLGHRGGVHHRGYALRHAQHHDGEQQWAGVTQLHPQNREKQVNMVLILDGSSEHGAHIWIKPGGSIC